MSRKTIIMIALALVGVVLGVLVGPMVQATGRGVPWVHVVVAVALLVLTLKATV